MKRWRLGVSALAVLAAVGVCALLLPALRYTAQPASVLSSHPIRWVLDAGHGGEDGGAVSVTGVAESGINLDIVRRMDAVLGLWGQPACLLREEDVSLHDPEAGTLREKKVSDLHNRAAAVEALQGATLVSIHQNSYPQSRYHGTQVFFAPTEGSQQLAEAIQQGVQGTLQPGKPPGSQADRRERLSDEPCEEPGGAGGVRLSLQSGGGTGTAGSGLSDPDGGGAGLGMPDGHRRGSFLTSPPGADSIKGAEARSPAAVRGTGSFDISRGPADGAGRGWSYENKNTVLLH